MSKRANLRTCMSCEWIFKMGVHKKGCPKCSWPSYGARCVYGDKAYRYAETQQPWFDKKLADFRQKLWKEIDDAKPVVPAPLAIGRPNR